MSEVGKGVHGFSGGSSGNELIERFVLSMSKTLEKIVPGLLTRLDWYFYQKYRESFLKHFIKNPGEAVNDLLEYCGGGSLRDNDTAKYIVYLVLKHVFSHNRSLFEKALNAALEGNWSELCEILYTYLKKHLKQVLKQPHLI